MLAKGNQQVSAPKPLDCVQPRFRLRVVSGPRRPRPGNDRVEGPINTIVQRSARKFIGVHCTFKSPYRSMVYSGVPGCYNGRDQAGLALWERSMVTDSPEQGSGAQRADHMDAQQYITDRVAPEPNTGCWLWLLSTNHGGYGKAWSGGKHWRAHRLAYVAFVGAIPPGLELDHLCRVRSCCNPEHLEPVTHAENLLRGETLAAACAAKTHCPRGHEYSQDNTLMNKGHRRCKECDRARERERGPRDRGTNTKAAVFTRSATE